MIALLFALMSNAMALGPAEWQAVLDAHRSPAGEVDYQAIASSSALDAPIASLAQAKVPESHAAKMAFWINAYNAITVQVVAKSWPIRSIRDLDDGSVWTTRRFQVAGETLTLDQIEKEKLVPLGDPRVHIALNCASIGCPPLIGTALTAENLDVQLSQATKRWSSQQGMRLDHRANVLVLHRIFDWYAADFRPKSPTAPPGVEPRLHGVIDFLAAHLPAPEREALMRGGYAVSFKPYDWAVNARGTATNPRE